MHTYRWGISLNPLQFRGKARTVESDKQSSRTWVLIPSSFGVRLGRKLGCGLLRPQRLNPLQFRGKARTSPAMICWLLCVLIPSSFGVRLGQLEVGDLTITARS